MTIRQSPRIQSPQDETALLTAALDHAWAWYDGQAKRSVQMINYYLIATAILFTAYTSAIGKYPGVAIALAVAGLLLTLLALTAVLHEVNGASLAEAPLEELQGRIARKLKADSIRMAGSKPGLRRMRTAIIVTTFSGAALLDIAGLVYAATR
jgi:hypothetical protein